jgi:hypothetical protein
MPPALATVATFDTAVKAQLARNALEAAGIPVTVTDESVVAMDWLLANAVGGIKVQVRPEDADRAVGVLETKFGEAGEGFGPADEAAFAAEAEAAEPEDADERDGVAAAADAPPPPPAAGDVDREDAARRLFFFGYLGLVVPVLLPVALYLFLAAALGTGPLSGRGRLNLIVGGLVTGLGLLGWWFLQVLVNGP